MKESELKKIVESVLNEQEDEKVDVKKMSFEQIKEKVVNDLTTAAKKVTDDFKISWMRNGTVVVLNLHVYDYDLKKGSKSKFDKIYDPVSGKEFEKGSFAKDPRFRPLGAWSVVAPGFDKAILARTRVSVKGGQYGDYYPKTKLSNGHYGVYYIFAMKFKNWVIQKDDKLANKDRVKKLNNIKTQLGFDINRALNGLKRLAKGKNDEEVILALKDILNKL